MNTLVDDAKQHGTAVGLPVDRITINGGKPLRGRIELKGAKNLVTKAMVAAILGDTPSLLRDVPNISDVRIVRGLLEVHGVTVTEGAEEGELILDPSAVVLGGGVSNLDLFYTEGVERVKKYVFNDELATPILRHEVGDSAGVLGAALLDA